MIVQTAFLRCAPEDAGRVQAALADVLAHVRAREPGTLAYRVLRSDGAGAVLFTTVESFADETAMALHNGSEAVARFFAVAGDLLSEPASLTVSREIAAIP